MGWKRFLLDAKSHYTKLSTSLYRLTKTLVAIYDDEDFLTECRGLKQEPHAFLDAEFPGLPFRFVELKAIFEAYPAEKDWRDNKLSALADAIPAAEREPSERKQPRRITVAEYEAVCKERDHFKYRAEYLEKQVAAISEELSDARSTITRMEGRLEEVERLQRA
jgi:hypothetical protein